MKAHELIKDYDNWTQCGNARKGDGSWCMWNHQEAACFCAQGAIMRAYDDPENEKAALRTLALHLIENHREDVEDGISINEMNRIQECQACGEEFSVPASVLITVLNDRGWTGAKLSLDQVSDHEGWSSRRSHALLYQAMKELDI